MMYEHTMGAGLMLATKAGNSGGDPPFVEEKREPWRKRANGGLSTQRIWVERGGKRFLRIVCIPQDGRKFSQVAMEYALDSQGKPDFDRRTQVVIETTPIRPVGRPSKKAMAAAAAAADAAAATPVEPAPAFTALPAGCVYDDTPPAEDCSTEGEPS
jgi:hypothetical protein